MERKYEKEASRFCVSVKELAANEAALENLKSYLSVHFGAWMRQYANSPEGLVSELETFAEIN